MPRLRQNIVTGEWVVIAPGRAKRPEDFVIEKPRTSARKAPCPFCKGGDGFNHALAEDRKNNVFVVPNKFPAFVKSAKEAPPMIKEDLGIYTCLPALGGHEVIAIADHMRDISHLTQKDIIDLISVYQSRYLVYEKSTNVAYTMIIHNHGPEAAQSIEHPHSQLFASSVIPNYVLKEIDGSKKYYQKKNICVFCDIVKQEKAFKKRIIFENKNFIAFTVFAARFPFEVWIMPQKHHPYFEDLEKEKLPDLADCLKDVLAKLDIKLNDPPHNFFIHTAPHKNNNDPAFDHFEGKKHYHWHIEIAPRISKFGGYELGSGMIIDVVEPEKAADYLKKD